MVFTLLQGYFLDERKGELHAAEERAETKKEKGMEKADKRIRSYTQEQCTSGKTSVDSYLDNHSRVSDVACTACIDQYFYSILQWTSG